MLYHRKKSWRLCAGRIPLFLLCCVLLFATGCTSSDTGSGSNKEATVAGESDTQSAQGTRDATPQVLTAQASGEVTYGSDLVTLDASHTSDGYVMLRYSGNNEKVKVQVTLPDSTEYTYPVTASEDYFVYPLPGGNGTYKITLLESVSAEDHLYAVSFTQDLDVQISDAFSPFLYPNFYVNFNSDSACVKREKNWHRVVIQIWMPSQIFITMSSKISLTMRKKPHRFLMVISRFRMTPFPPARESALTTHP